MNIDMNEFEKEYNEFIEYLKKRKENNFNDDGIIIPNVNKNISTSKIIDSPNKEITIAGTPISNTQLISPSKTEKKTELNEKLKRIQQLREDIANGKVVKTPVGNGKFIWKRIK